MTNQRIKSLHLTQLPIPEGGEGASREFWITILGFTEMDKSASMVGSGVWLTYDHGRELHLVVRDPFVPVTDHQFGFLTDDADALRSYLQGFGVPVRPAPTRTGTVRYFVSDPFGNEFEIISFTSESDN